MISLFRYLGIWASIDELDNSCQFFTGNYKEWMKNALSLEASDWKSSNDPELDENENFQTSLARTVFQMVDENLQVAATISPGL